MSTALSVNLNKIAVLRNSRGGSEPDVARAGIACLDAGAHGLTVHPRPDARHIREDDVHVLAAVCHARGVELNIEGNPFAPARARDPLGQQQVDLLRQINEGIRGIPGNTGDVSPAENTSHL